MLRACHCGCRVLPPPQEISTNRQNRTPHQPPARCCHSTQCRLHNTCFTLQGLHLTFQCPMVCPGLASCTLAGLCALWLPSAALSRPQEISTNQQNRIPHIPTAQHCLTTTKYRLHYTCFTLQNVHLTLELVTAEAAFDLPVPHGMPRAGHSQNGRAL